MKQKERERRKNRDAVAKRLKETEAWTAFAIVEIGKEIIALSERVRLLEKSPGADEVHADLVKRLYLPEPVTPPETAGP